MEPYWPNLFAKLFEKRSIADLITNVGAGQPSLKLSLCHAFSGPIHVPERCRRSCPKLLLQALWAFPRMGSLRCGLLLADT